MAILNQAMLAKLAKEGNKFTPTYQGNGFTITRNILFCGNVINIIKFGNGKKYVTELSDRCSSYITMGKYLLSIKSSDDILDFSDIIIYHIASGEASDQQSISIENSRTSNIIVLDGKIFAVCNGRVPRFFAVIAGKLEELTTTAVECALMQPQFSESQQQSFFRFYAEEGWGNHNGIVVNPKTKAVPGVLHYEIWLKAHKRMKIKMRKHLDTSFLAVALTRSHDGRSGVRALNSQQF